MFHNNTFISVNLLYGAINAAVVTLLSHYLSKSTEKNKTKIMQTFAALETGAKALRAILGNEYSGTTHQKCLMFMKFCNEIVDANEAVIAISSDNNVYYAVSNSDSDIKEVIAKRDEIMKMGTSMRSLLTKNIRIATDEMVTLRDISREEQLEYVRSISMPNEYAIAILRYRIKEPEFFAELERLQTTTLHTSAAGIIEPMLWSFYDKPVTRFMPLKELCNHIIGRADACPGGSIQEVAVKLSREMNANITVNIYTIGSPFETRMEQLIENQRIRNEGLETPMSNGLNKKNLKRFQTILQLKPREANLPASFHVDAKSSKTITIETFNGAEWRRVEAQRELPVADMTPTPSRAVRNSSDTLKSHTRRRPAIIGSAEVAGPSVPMLPQNYNEIQESVIMHSSYLPLTKNRVKLYEETLRDTAAAPIQNEIEIALTAKLDAALGEEIPKSSFDFRKLMLSFTESFPHILFSVIRNTRSEVSIQSNITVDTAEYALTYLSQFDTVLFEFTKAYKSNVYAVEIPSAYFETKSAGDMISIMRNVWRIDVLERTFDSMARVKQWDKFRRSLKEFILSRVDA